MDKNILTNGHYISVYCEPKFSYIIDNILSYYDIEKYNNTVVVLCYKFDNFNIIENQFENIIVYNVEHYFCYADHVCDEHIGYFRQYLNKILEFWDFDILNYDSIIHQIPEIIQKYKFVPFRYVDRPIVDKNIYKKFDAIQIGITRHLSPYRDSVITNFISSKSFDNFSLLTIEKSKYSLEELYDEINLSKFVLNIPRLQNSVQEQVRIGELISMNCNVITHTNYISYMQDYVHEVDYFSNTLNEDISNIILYDNIHEKFKNDTNNENFCKYVNSCFDKWYKTDNSYYFSVIISSININSLNDTINSLKNNNLFNRIQIILVDISSDELIEKTYKNSTNNIYYIKSDIHTVEHAFNIGLQCSIGKYVSFCVSGDKFYSKYYDRSYDDLEKKQSNIRISNYIYNSRIYIPTFEQLKIGPMLQCCLIKRNIINIQFDEDNLCASNTFTGILCKNFNYDTVVNTIDDDEAIGPIISDIQDIAEDEPVKPDNFDWIKYTQEKINEQ